MIKSTIRSLMPEAIYDTFRRAKQKRATNYFVDYVVEQNVAGIPLKIAITDPVAEEWYGHGPAVSLELDFLKTLDLEGKTIFDLGSHQCVSSMALAEMAGNSGVVVAVEPNAHNYRIATKNVAINGYENVVPVKAILSSGSIDVSIDGGLVGKTRLAGDDTPDLRILSIDDLSATFGDPGLIYMDIEGHEIEALVGALKTLATPNCHWLIELHGDEDLMIYGHKNSDIFRFFPSGMFKPHFMDPVTGKMQPLQRKSLPHGHCHVFFERVMGNGSGL